MTRRHLQFRTLTLIETREGTQELEQPLLEQFSIRISQHSYNSTFEQLKEGSNRTKEKRKNNVQTTTAGLVCSTPPSVLISNCTSEVQRQIPTPTHFTAGGCPPAMYHASTSHHCSLHPVATRTKHIHFTRTELRHLPRSPTLRLSLVEAACAGTITQREEKKRASRLCCGAARGGKKKKIVKWREKRSLRAMLAATRLKRTIR